MPNLSKAVTKVSLNGSDGKKQLRQLQQNLLDLENNLPKDVDELAKYDADTILADLLVGYMDYVERNDIENPSYPAGYILKTNSGYKVSLYGKNLWYYEFGTGDKGEQSNYEATKTMQNVNYVYNAGPTVIHANSYSPGDTNYDSNLPKVYIDTANKHPGIVHHNWWVHKNERGPLSNGIPAGRILYDTIASYRGNLESGSKSSGGISKNNLTYKIKNNLLKGIKK